MLKCDQECYKLNYNVLYFVSGSVPTAVMRMSTAAHVPLLLVLIVGSFVVEAARHRITVKTYKTNYRVDSWDDGRDEPYRVTYWKFGLKSVYLFKASGTLTSLTVRGREYTFPSGEGSRKLLPVLGNEAGEEVHSGRRRLFPCADCEEAWDVLCDVGLADVCFLDEFPRDDFNEDAEDSTRRFCSAFGAACETPAFDSCEGQCVESESCLLSDASSYIEKTQSLLEKSISFNGVTYEYVSKVPPSIDTPDPPTHPPYPSVLTVMFSLGSRPHCSTFL